MTEPPALADQPDDWTEPGAWPVAPGVSRIPLPLPMDGLRAVNVYVVEADDGLVLVDGGWAIPEARKLFEAGIRQLGHELGDLRRYLVTHAHRDHYTMARVLGDELGIDVALGVGDRPTLELINDRTLAEDPNRARFVLAGALELYEDWRAMLPEGRPDTAGYGMPDSWLDGDQTLDLGGRSVEAVSTPGHTQGHFVFADTAAGLLFAGDHVLPTITPSIGFEPTWVEQPLRDFLASLAKVRALPDLRVLPAHGPVTSSAHARVDELLAHHEHRLALCHDAVAGGARTAWEVAAEIPWTRRNRRRDELGPFDATLAAFETLAHLELLALRGDLVRSDGEDGSRRFDLRRGA